MNIKKIQKKVKLQNQNKVELQACYSDCTEYKLNTSAIYDLIRAAGYKADGTESSEQIREIMGIFGAYCYKAITPKTSVYL